MPPVLSVFHSVANFIYYTRPAFNLQPGACCYILQKPGINFAVNFAE